MSPYLTIAAIFFVLGIYTFALFRWWFQHVTALAARYDIPERRKRAARRYFVVMFFILVPQASAVLGCISMARELVLFVAIAFMCSTAPAIVWWMRRIPSLHALGYGKQE